MNNSRTLHARTVMQALLPACMALLIGCDAGTGSHQPDVAEAGGNGTLTGGAATSSAGNGGAGGVGYGGASSAGVAGTGLGGGGAAVNTAGAAPGTGGIPAVFVHPGALSSKSQLDFVKGRVSAGAEPWKGELERLKASPLASRTPNATPMLDSKNDAAANTARDDALGAYALALLWYYSSDDTYAQKGVAILAAWSSFQAFTSHTDQDKLLAGWLGAVLGPAAEILRQYPGWKSENVAQLQGMFKTAFYPQLNTASTWNGNVDLTQIDALFSLAVFNDDPAAFALAVERWHRRVPAYFYLKADGPMPPAIPGDGGNSQSFWGNPSQWVDGLTQETCRDNGHHAQFALGSAIHGAEVAWNQGIDLYTGETARFSAALELMATQLLSGSMQGTCPSDVPTSDRFDTWEIAFNHYHHRQGLALPKTQQLITTQIRPAASRADWNLAYETLTHAYQ